MPRLLPVATLMPHFIIQEKFRLPIITIEAMALFTVNLRIPKIKLESKKNTFKLCISKKDKKELIVINAPRKTLEMIAQLI